MLKWGLPGGGATTYPSRFRASRWSLAAAAGAHTPHARDRGSRAPSHVSGGLHGEAYSTRLVDQRDDVLHRVHETIEKYLDRQRALVPYLHAPLINCVVPVIRYLRGGVVPPGTRASGIFVQLQASQLVHPQCKKAHCTRDRGPAGRRPPQFGSSAPSLGVLGCPQLG